MPRARTLQRARSDRAAWLDGNVEGQEGPTAEPPATLYGSRPDPCDVADIAGDQEGALAPFVIDLLRCQGCDVTTRQTRIDLPDGQPAIWVDTKKKELVGDFKNNGRELRPKGDPEPVRVHDFELPELGKVAPYGVYDITANSGWVNVGVVL